MLSALARISVSIGLFDRPLVIGFILGFVTQQMELLLPLAVVTELFWLDVLRLGAVVPPMASLGYLLLVPILFLFHLQSPQQLGVPVLLAFTCACFAGWLELWVRHYLNRYIERIHVWIAGERGGLSPENIVRRAVIGQGLLYFSLYLLCFVLLYTVLHFLALLKWLPTIPLLTWNAWYGVALLGAVLALRTRRAYAFLIVCAGVICAMYW